MATTSMSTIFLCIRAVLSQTNRKFTPREMARFIDGPEADVIVALGLLLALKEVSHHDDGRFQSTTIFDTGEG